MKQLTLILTLALACQTMNVAAQTYGMWKGMNYQGVARDANGDPLANQTISLLLQLNYAISLAYHETQTTTTNDQGLFSVIMGEGTYVNGHFTSWEEINWDGAIFYSLNISADFTGGTNYQSLGFQQIHAVPFAQRARQADAAKTMIDDSWRVDTILKFHFSSSAYDVGIGTSSPTSKLEVDGFTKLGTDAPAIKYKKLTGMANGTGSIAPIMHGLDGSKILNVDVHVQYVPSGKWIPASSETTATDLRFDYAYDLNSVDILFRSGGIYVNSPVKILITYEE